MTRSVRALHTVAILLVALTMGLEFAHVLELGPRLGYSPQHYIADTNTLYVWFATLGGAVYVLSVPASAALAWSVRHRARPALLLTGGATVLQAIGLASWLALILPVNLRLEALAPGAVPPDFVALRTQWELSHAAGFVLFAGAFLLLLLAASSRRAVTPGHVDPDRHAVRA